MAERVGLGYDSHAFDEGRTLWLGGLEFAGEPGLAGHSDGDVVCHALADALLGSVALGDIGQHFPDGDPTVAGIAGADLLGRVVGLVAEAGYAPSSCDLVVIGDRPRISERRDEMRASLARVLRIERDAVSVKATSAEGLSLGGQGIACMALVTASSG